MSVIAETGAGLPNAESYCSSDFADDYHTNFNNVVWLGFSEEAKDAALRYATQYMVGYYRMRWKGRRVLITQTLDWPRVGVVLEDFGGSQGRNGFGSYDLFQVDYKIVPLDVKNACAELALRVATSGPLAADLSQRAIEKTIGPIKIKYAENSQENVRYPQIDNMLRVYLLAGGNKAMVGMIRC